MSCVGDIGDKPNAKVNKSGQRDKDHEIYPYEFGDKIILGPDVFADGTGDRISWRGVSYYRSLWKEVKALED